MGLDLVQRALTLDPTAFRQLSETTGGFRLSFQVVFLAGLSAGLGQSVVLFLNRVRPHRFVASLIVSAGLYLFGYLFWAFSVWLVADLVFGREGSLLAVAQGVGLAYAPYLFGFFILTPYLGSFINVGLSVWSLLAIVVAARSVLLLTLPQAVACAALGWLLIQVTQRTVGRPVLWLAGRVRGWVAGTRIERDLDRLLERRRATAPAHPGYAGASARPRRDDVPDATKGEGLSDRPPDADPDGRARR